MRLRGSIPNVLECNCVTGEYSMLKVAFQSTMELDIFIGQLLNSERPARRSYFLPTLARVG